MCKRSDIIAIQKDKEKGYERKDEEAETMSSNKSDQSCRLSLKTVQV